MTASLLKSPGLVSGFWPFSSMLSFGWSLPIFQLPNLLGLLIILLLLCQIIIIIIITIIYSLEFFTSAYDDGLHWRLSDSKSPQVSKTILSILAVFNNAVVWMVSTRPPTSKSSKPFNNFLVTVPKAPITMSMIVTFMFHSFFNSQARSFHILSVLFYGQPGQQSQQFCRFSFFLLIIIRSGLLAKNRWSVCILKSHRSLCVSFSVTGAGLCRYHLLAWSNLNFLHISPCFTLPTQSCLALYSFCASLLHLLYSCASLLTCDHIIVCTLFILKIINWWCKSQSLVPWNQMIGWKKYWPGY